MAQTFRIAKSNKIDDYFISSTSRINVYDGKGKLIGQDYQRENGDWMHKWMDNKTGSFEKGSWKGRCKGDNSVEWTHKDCH